MSYIHLGLFLNVFLGFICQVIVFNIFKRKDSCVYNVYVSIANFLPL